MKPFRGKYILIAIDGTDSSSIVKTTGTTNTRLFYEDFPTPKADKKYIHGPGGDGHGGIRGTAAGYTSSVKIQTAVKFVQDRLAAHYKYKGNYSVFKPYMKLSKKEKINIRRMLQDKNKPKNNIRICIVGHSRGGMIAIQAAKLMPLPVYFLGLYDAVNMTPNQTSAKRIHNVDHTYHAMRDPNILRSRRAPKYVGFVSPAYYMATEWGNCGLKSSGTLTKKIFYTSHGGVNGTAEFWSSGMFSEDVCFNGTKRAKKNSKKLGTSNISLLCETQGVAADQFIRNGARYLGIKIPN